MLLEKYIVIHQTGDSEFQDYEVLLQRQTLLPDGLKSRYILQKFVFPSHIGDVYHRSTLVVGRAGANTSLELIALHKPCLLIPLPHGQMGEQTQNALLLNKLGLAEILYQSNLNGESLVQAIDMMVQNIEKYSIPDATVQQYTFPDAARRIVDVITAQYEKKIQEKKRN